MRFFYLLKKVDYHKFCRRLGLEMLSVLLLAFFCIFITASAENANNDVENACRGVVRILSMEETGFSVGSGFGVGRAGEETDIFVTNWHVVTPEDGSESKGVYILLSNDAVQFWNDGSCDLDMDQMLKCEVLYKSTGYPDIAILKAERPVENHIALPLMRAQEAHRGDNIYAIGFPGSADLANGKEYYYAEIEDVNVSTGVISKFFKFEIGGSTWAIQHDAHINHGNSGGPLVTKDGAVIGINTYGLGEGMEYSVSIFVDYAIQALNELGITYDIYDSGSPSADIKRILYLAGIGALLLILIFVSLKVVKKKKGERSSGVFSSPGYNPTTAPKPGSAIWQIRGISGFFAGKQFNISRIMKFGRAVEGNDLRYPSEFSGISRFHCEIKQENGIAYIRDMNSSYGTYIGGKRLPANEWIEMHHGDRFYLANEKESFQIVRTL